MQITTLNDGKDITAQENILNAHQFLLDFLGKFENAKRGGIHDFIEISLFNISLSCLTLFSR